MHILYLSQYFPPEMGAPAARVFELSREWVALGHQVTVVTGFPNHPDGVIPPEYRGQFLRRENVEGISVIRVPIYASPNKGVVRRSASYLSYGLSAAVLAPIMASRPDVLVATSPQMLTAVAGAWVAALRHVPFVFEVRDIWPRSIVEVGALNARHPVIRGLEALEMGLYRRADRIVVVTDSFVSELAQRGVLESKLRVVKNGVDLELFQPRPRDERVRGELGIRPSDLMCLYVGTHGMAHGLETILDAAAQLRDRDDIRFVLVGEGADKAALLEKARSLRLERLTFIPKQPREKIPEFLAASDLSLVLLKGKPLFKTVLPSKIFEILGAARPIVLGVDGEARRLVVDDAEAGVFVEPEDANQLARTIADLASKPELLRKMGERGRTYVKEHYSRASLARKYAEYLSELLPAR